MSDAEQSNRVETRPGVVRLIGRALALRCPTCGVSKIFRGWFTMDEVCPSCGRRHDRGPGYFLGSIYFNYGVTALLVIVLFFGCFLTDLLTGDALLGLLALFTILFPVWFFRYARSLWIAFDELWDPQPNPKRATRVCTNDTTGN